MSKSGQTNLCTVMFNRWQSMYLFLVETEKNQCLLKEGGFYERKISYVLLLLKQIVQRTWW